MTRSSHSRCLALIVLAGVLFLSACEIHLNEKDGASGLSLYGSEALYSGHGGAYPPSEQNRATDIWGATVEDGVEFEQIADSALSGFNVINADIDIGPRSVEVQYLQGATANNAEFNGYFITFENAPRITNVALSNATTALIDYIDLMFQDDGVLINVAGLPITAGDTIVVDVELE